MSKTTERRKVLSVGEKITRENIIDGGASVEIFSISDCTDQREETNPEEVKGTQEYLEKYFPVVKASTLSLEDEFLKYEPETDLQSKFKERLTKAIESGLSDFRAQRMDPTLGEDGKIYYQAGKKPKVDRCAYWWKREAEEFMPEKESRLGTTKERTAFLGLLIKYLIEKLGYTVSDAWQAVCDQSKDLGHYRDSESAKHYPEPTGRRQVGNWYDLGNTFKITIDDEAGGLSVVGGSFNRLGDWHPLMFAYTLHDPDYDFDYSVGWLVLSV